MKTQSGGEVKFGYRVFCGGAPRDGTNRATGAPWGDAIGAAAVRIGPNAAADSFIVAPAASLAWTRRGDGTVSVRAAGL